MGPPAIPSGPNQLSSALLATHMSWRSLLSSFIQTSSWPTRRVRSIQRFGISSCAHRLA
ncbi:hypothetical protein PTT_14522 [Pyrenophora teres f. teres 0-1]|uniref:Uncharacterized protein n=1 Tax=Pyrenophora teres f. teres (strain 0-1) TaxID=861557 RepID=E3RYC3_PYRTT|nr:hypothetical protein PTT_14522 [Pyrenophora teres f. teres 0-1]